MDWQTLVDEANETALVGKVLSWVSIITVSATIITFVIFPSKRRFPARLPLHMCVAVLGVNLSVLIGLYHPDAFCPYQAIGIQLFGLAAVFWWLIISVNFYWVTVLDRVEPVFEFPYVCIGWVIPGVLVVIARLTHQLDSTPQPFVWECWMQNTSGVAQWLCFYAEMGLACVVGAFLWPRVAIVIYKAHDVEPSSVVLGYVRHLVFIILYFAVFVTMLVYRIKTDIDEPTFPLAMAHTVCVCTTGIYCFFVWGLTQQNYMLWRGLFLGESHVVANQPFHQQSSKISSYLDHNDGNRSSSNSGRTHFASRTIEHDQSLYHTPLLSSASNGEREFM